MSVRLNKSERAEILEKLVNKAFKQRVDAQKASNALLFDQLVDLVVGEHKSAIEALPARFMPTADYLSIESWTYVLSGCNRRIPQTYQYGLLRYSDIEAMPGGNILSSKIYKHFQEDAALTKETNAFREEVKAILNSCTTPKKLYTVWPELKEVHEISEASTACTALAVPTQRLNKLLGIGQAKDAA